MAITNDEILTMSFPQLQEECRKANLSLAGDENILRFRLLWCLGRSNDEADDAESVIPKRPRSSSSSSSQPVRQTKRQKIQQQQCQPSNHLICSITLELPTCPVIGEDGFIYERSAIEEYFDSRLRDHPGAIILSPMTTQPMGRRLVPAPQIKSLIESLIERGGVIQDELAQKWMETTQATNKMEQKLKLANKGNIHAMLWVAQRYLKANGTTDGIKRDATLAYQWYERAHLNGSVIGTAAIGNMLTQDTVPASYQEQGVLYLSLAARKGSDFAALALAAAYARGKFGLDVDKAKAHELVEKALFHSTIKHMSQKSRLKAQKLYQESSSKRRRRRCSQAS